jgi:holo-[acyl-carrier protein] synthase
LSSKKCYGNEMIVGLGIDCEEIARWNGLSKDSVSDSRYALFSGDEHAYCSSSALPAQHYAGRWCLKEATVKALAGIIAITTRDVEVIHVAHKNPTVLVAQRARVPAHISLLASVTHSEKTAAAVVVAESRPEPSDNRASHEQR